MTLPVPRFRLCNPQPLSSRSRRTSTLYSLLIESNLSEAARKAIEMEPGLDKFFTDTQRRTYERGRAEGEVAALLKILTRRGVMPNAEQRRQLLECTDLTQIEQWLDRALLVSSVDELLSK